MEMMIFRTNSLLLLERPEAKSTLKIRLIIVNQKGLILIDNINAC